MLLRLFRRMLRKSNTSTADTTAAVRARHQRYDKRLLDDPLAKDLCGPLWKAALRIKPLGWFLDDVLMRSIQPVSMCVLMRARYAEQALERAAAEGAEQYAIIGAGMDSFAFRRADMMKRIDVFEIDHPETQKAKLARIEQAGWAKPERLHFVPADLSEVSAAEALRGSAFDPAKRTFFTLLGVSYYITAEDLANTARSIAQEAPAGSALALDYLLDEGDSDPSQLEMRASLQELVAGMGEPMRSEYSLESMSALMDAENFDTAENMNMIALKEPYLEQVGFLPFETPGIFGIGIFRTRERGS